jgi:RecA/RadA recombinase
MNSKNKLKRTRGKSSVSSQMVEKSENDSKLKRQKEFDGNTELMISTGSTLLDLAITGGRIKGGGIPGGIFVEIFGPSGMGKTVLLCEIAGSVKRAGGNVMFSDPEARLNNQFASMFGLDVGTIEYNQPNTVPEVFKPIRNWEPGKGPIHGAFSDSLAALSTDMELEEKDQYGARRAKEFSEELRKTCRIIPKKNILMVASNQIRDNFGAQAFEAKWTVPGGKALEFYASLRLRIMAGNPAAIKKKIKAKGGKEVTRIIGINSVIEVHKSSIWKPKRQAPISIIFDYGIDDVRANIQYLKDYTTAKSYMLGEEQLGKSMSDAIRTVEENGWEKKLKRAVIRVWTELESQFEEPRKEKER